MQKPVHIFSAKGIVLNCVRVKACKIKGYLGITAMIERYLKEFRIKGLAALSNMDDDEQTTVATWARKVVDQYGAVLNELPIKIKDTKDLPYPKETIKIAIKTLMQAYVLTKSDDMLNILKDRYVRLSSFQEINPEDKKTAYTEVGDINQALSSSDTSLTSTYQKNMQIVLSEEKILLEDIRTYLRDL